MAAKIMCAGCSGDSFNTSQTRPLRARAAPLRREYALGGDRAPTRCGAPREGRHPLHRAHDDVTLRLHELTRAPAAAGRLPRRHEQTTDRARRLDQELLAVREEQHPRPAPPLLCKPSNIKRREPRLAEARREHDERAPPPLCARFGQRDQRLLLELVG